MLCAAVYSFDHGIHYGRGDPDALWIFRAYDYLFQSAGRIVRAYGITILVTAVGTTLNVMMTMFMAYLLSKQDLPGRSFLSFFIFFTMLFSGGMVPSYIVWSQYMHVGDSLRGLIFPNLALGAYNVILMRTYFTTNVPRDILEAALKAHAFHGGAVLRTCVLE